MPDYNVRFFVHLKESTRPEGWPHTLYHDCLFREPDFQAMKKRANQEALMFVQQQGVVVLKESKIALQDDIATFDLMRFIPMHMIAYIDKETKVLTTDIPDDETEGVIYQ